MTKLAPVAGGSIPQQRNRLRGVEWLRPMLLADGATQATSTRGSTTVVASATPNTVGAWVEVVNTLSADVGMIRVNIMSTSGVSGADSSTLLNVGVGGSGSEVAVISGLGIGWSTSQHPGWEIPLFIPAGSRVAIQTQSLTVSKSVDIKIDFYSVTQGLKPSGSLIAMGTTPATHSHGVILATPGLANTEGAWTEIVSATAEPFTALVVSIQGGADAVQGSVFGLIDIASGGSGSETAIISDIGVSVGTTELVVPLSTLIHPARVPAGTRLSARNQLNGLTTTLDVVLHGVRRSA